MSVVQTWNVGFTSEVSDYLVVHTGHDCLLWELVAAVYPTSAHMTRFAAFLLISPEISSPSCILHAIKSVLEKDCDKNDHD